MSDSLRPHGLQNTSLPCPLPSPGVCSNSCPLSQWCHPAISSSVIPCFSHLQSFPASGSFPMSQFFASGSQSIGVSASESVLLMNIQDWFPLGWTGWISLQSKGLSRAFSNNTVQKYQFFGTLLSGQCTIFQFISLWGPCSAFNMPVLRPQLSAGLEGEGPGQTWALIQQVAVTTTRVCPTKLRGKGQYFQCFSF